MKGLINVLNKIEKVLPGNKLTDDALTKEHIKAECVYNAEQAHIASIPVEPTSGAVFIPPGMYFTPSLPTVCVEVQQGSRRGIPQYQ